MQEKQLLIVMSAELHSVLMYAVTWITENLNQIACTVVMETNNKMSDWLKSIKLLRSQGASIVYAGPLSQHTGTRGQKRASV